MLQAARQNLSILNGGLPANGLLVFWCVLSKEKKSQYEVGSFTQDKEGRVLSLLVKIKERMINVVNVYCPSGITDRREFLRELHQYFYPGVPKIVGGDFNCVESDIDYFGHSTDACKAGAEELKLKE